MPADHIGLEGALSGQQRVGNGSGAPNMSDVRALLLTDVVDSTQLLERLGDEAAATLWAAHDRAARDLLREWRGLEIDRTDGFLLLFESASDALGYALAYHRALAGFEVPLRARAGLHIGPVILRHNSPADVALGAKPVEVEGLAKPVAARVMAIAQGGQTLLTAPARDALGPMKVRIESHGHWRVKGVAEPFELFEAGDDDAPFTPPPDSAKAYRVVQRRDLWLPVREVRHSLPAERDAFVGRHEPLLELAHRFEAGARLVSVLGMGGSGKTRLATRFGWTWLGDFSGGVWFCDLSQARTIDGIVAAVAHGLDVPLGKDDPIAQLGSAIAGRGPCLVILDNFEQVARHAQETLGRWLDAAGEAHFLVTTREVLGLPGEQTYALAPLPGSEAEELFMRRAEAAKSNLAVTAEDRAAIAPLVKLLDGLPLAIELAAARVRLMPPRTLLARMGERFRLLASAGGRQDRHATLRATFDWSWDLLSPAEKSALAQLSVFEGGFTQEAAEAIVDLSACDGAPWIVDVLQSLLDKSLVRAVGRDRFDLLSSVQAYAAEQLATEGRFPGSGADGRQDRRSSATAPGSRRWAQSGQSECVRRPCQSRRCVPACDREFARAACDRRTAGCLGCAESQWTDQHRRRPRRGSLCLCPDLDTRSAAIAQCGSRQRSGFAGASGGRAAPLRDCPASCSRMRRPRLPGERADQGLQPSMEAKAELPEARAGDCRRAIAGARARRRCRLNAPPSTASQTSTLPKVDLDEARASYEAALERARDASNLDWQCWLLGNLGIAVRQPWPHGRGPTVLRAVAGAGSAHSVTGNVKATPCAILGCCISCRSAWTRRSKFPSKRYASHATSGTCASRPSLLCNLGLAHEEHGRTQDALRSFDAALRAMRQLGDRRGEGQFLGYLGRTRARLRDFDSARECFAAGRALLRRGFRHIEPWNSHCATAPNANGAPATSRGARALRRGADIGRSSRCRSPIRTWPSLGARRSPARRSGAVGNLGYSFMIQGSLSRFSPPALGFNLPCTCSRCPARNAACCT